MTNAYNELVKGIMYVLDNCTSYQVAKDLGIANRTINRYQNGTTDIEKMSLKTAKMIYEYYLKLKEEMKMKTLNYSGFEYNDKQVELEMKVKNFEDVLNVYEKTKYSDTDFEQEPSDFEAELAHDLATELEEIINDDYETVTIGFKNNDTGKNDFMSFDYTIKEEYETTITVELEYRNSWSE